jgi:hypothetical protein
MLAVYGGGGGNCGTHGNWWCQVLDNWGDPGRYSSIDLWGNSSENWKMGISYYKATKRALKVAILTCGVTCSWSFDTVSSPDFNYLSIGLYSSFKFNSSGMPGVAYYISNSIGDSSLHYAHVADSG